MKKQDKLTKKSGKISWEYGENTTQVYYSGYYQGMHHIQMIRLKKENHWWAVIMGYKGKGAKSKVDVSLPGGMETWRKEDVNELVILVEDWAKKHL